MKVSLCMIVKDEVERLNNCLDSVEELVDEIVIVDTGSTDGTLDIVRERAHTWDERAWDGFADARNHSIDLASGDVILVLDADEVITDTEGWEKALELLEEGSDGIAFLLFNELPTGQLLKADRMWQVRMWRNRPEARFSGRVHNQITAHLKDNPLDGEKAEFHQCNIQIHHKGYNLTPEEMKGKYKSRLKDLLFEIENAPDEKIKSYYQFQTSNAYFMLGEKGESLKYARDCNLDKLTHENRYSLSLMAVHNCHILGLNEEGLEWAKELLDVWPNEVMSFLMMGLSLMGLGRYRGAYNFLGAVLALCQLRGMSYKYVLDPSYVAGAAGESALALKRYREAKELFQMHLQSHDNPRVAKLEAAIIPVEEAKGQGLTGEEEDPLLQEVEQGTEELEIQDLRKTG